MSPRRSIAAAAGTRSAILAHAVDVASVTGLEGLTIGALADDLSMSKAGVVGPFGSKEALQLAALDRAVEIFTDRVWRPAAGAEPGLPRLRALYEARIGYLSEPCFPGGCFLASASPEFDGRPGPVRDGIAAALARWHAVLDADVRTAITAGDLPADADPAQLVFELEAFAVAANQAIQLHRDPSAAERFRRAVARTLPAGT